MIDELRELSLEIEGTQGTVNGIIHAAGNLSRHQFEIIEDTTPENVFDVFAPKVLGVLNLYEIFRNRCLDFVWITSSLASIVGGLRFAAYSSANAFMEHFISARSKELPNWICIGLSEIGITEIEDVSNAGPGERHLGAEALIALFELSLGCKHSPVIYETIKNLHDRTREAFSESKGIEDPVRFDIKKTERPNLDSSFAPPSSKTEKIMIDLLEDFLGMRGLGVEDNFFDLGGDSLKATGFLLRIRNTFDIPLAVTVFFSSPTIKQLSLKIDEILLLKSKKAHGSRQII
jgi:polyketide synthase PksN